MSNCTIRGVLHVAPPLSENAARIALRWVELSKPIVIACSRPLGLKDSHGSVARSYPPVLPVPPAQFENAGALEPHVVPPLVV